MPENMYTIRPTFRRTGKDELSEARSSADRMARGETSGTTDLIKASASRHQLGLVAQWIRAPASEAGGRRFESCQDQEVLS